MATKKLTTTIEAAVAGINRPGRVSTLPGETVGELPPGLSAAVANLEELTGKLANVREVIDANGSRLSELSGIKMRLSAQLSETSASVQLGEASQATVISLRKELAATEQEISELGQSAPHLRRRYLETAETLPECVTALHEARAAYTRGVLEAFAREYASASDQMAAVMAKGQAIARALRVPVDMPTPTPSLDAVELDAGTARLQAAMDAADSMAAGRYNIERAAAKAASIRQKFNPAGSYEAIRDGVIGGRSFRQGDRLTTADLSARDLERLYNIRMVRPV
jgi:hypothetical protein